MEILHLTSTVLLQEMTQQESSSRASVLASIRLLHLLGRVEERCTAEALWRSFRGMELDTVVQQFQDEDGGNSDVTDCPEHGLTSQRLVFVEWRGKVHAKIEFSHP